MLNLLWICLQGGTDSPDLEFVYADADIFNNEIAELYSYTEQPEFQLNVKVNFTIIKSLLLKLSHKTVHYDCIQHEASSNVDLPEFTCYN